MANDLEKIKMVYDYAKFHIGLYTSVVAATIGIAKISGAGSTANNICLEVSGIIGIAFVILAGVCGGVVAVNVPNLIDLRYIEFTNQKLSICNIISLEIRNWLKWEHIFLALYGFQGLKLKDTQVMMVKGLCPWL